MTKNSPRRRPSKKNRASRNQPSSRKSNQSMQAVEESHNEDSLPNTEEIVVQPDPEDDVATSCRTCDAPKLQDSRKVEASEHDPNQIVTNLGDWVEYAKRLETQVKQLQIKPNKESRHNVEKGKSDREIEKLTQQVQALQADALGMVDRYEPATDSTIRTEFEGLARAVQEAANLSTKKMKSSLPESEWEMNVSTALNPLSFNNSLGAIRYRNTTVRTMLLKNALWQFLNTELLANTFRSYGGSVAEAADTVYRSLFPDPRNDKDSTRWRSMTASKLDQIMQPYSAKNVVDGILALIQDEVMSRLGYEKDDKKLVTKLHKICVQSINFARLIAQQRAIFELTFPDVCTSELFKDADDPYLTNLEDQNDSNATSAGRVWFVSDPALFKHGNGVGDMLETSMVVVKANVKLSESGGL